MSVAYADRMKRSLTVLSLAFFLLDAGSASAAGSSAEVLVGYAVTDADDDAIDVGYDMGLGARGGFTLPFNVYVGATFLYHVGTHTNATSSNVWYLGGEGGYEIELAPITVRPYVGVGYANWRSEWAANSCGLASCSAGIRNDGSAALWPGLAIVGNIGSYFVGGDFRYVVLFDVFDGNTAGAFLTGGLRF
jgi:hypothetical protein